MIRYPVLLGAVEADDMSALLREFETMTPQDLAAAGTFVGPVRLRAVIDRASGRFDAVARWTTPAIASGWHDSPFACVVTQPTAEATQNALIEVFREGFGEYFFKGPVRPRIPPTLTHAVHEGLVAIESLRKSALQTPMPRDVTKTLLAQDRCPAPITDQDYAAAAARQGISSAAIKAVAQVESGGRSGFDAEFRPKILFEAHHFSRHTEHRFDETHPHLSTRTRAEAKAFYRWDQYPRLFEAMLLDPGAACMSASWGKFQVLGSNHSGWPDAISFAKAMFESEANHLRSFEAFCQDNNLTRYLKAKNWAGFAAGYNGPNYKEFDYDTKIGKAYAAAGGV